MRLIALSSLAIFLSLASLNAYEPYHATITVDFLSANVSAPNLVDLNRDLKTTAIETLLPIYTPTSPISINYNLRGIDAIAAFAANSTELVVTIPDTGDTLTFDGGTRDASLQLFKEFIRDAGNHGNLLRAYAKHSPIDPVAGNPNSLIAQMAQADYLLGRLSPLSGCDCNWSAQPIIHQFQCGLNVTRAFAQKFDTTTVTIPTRYSYSPDLRWALIIDLPITYYRNGGASTLLMSLGLGLRLPVTSRWSLTPIVRAGNAGTLDLCTAGSFISFGITSCYDYKGKHFIFSLINYAAYTTSTNFWLTGINFNYHLQDYIFKNGFTITGCQGVTFCNRPIHFSLSFEDTYFTGNRLFIKHYDEVTLALIATGIIPRLDYDCLSLGFTYQFGEKKYKGYTLSLNYQF